MIESRMCVEVFQNKLAINIKKRGYIYPSKLHQSTLTTAAIDNLDHNLTSTSVKFIFQHADTSPQSATFRIYAKNIEEKKLELPNSYTEIRTTSACKSE